MTTMKHEIFLGIDTSNYTTSIAAINKYGHRLFDIRIPLEVKKGKRGLRQQEAVFQHIKNLGEIAGKIESFYGNISAVASSVSPRNVEGSYMPVFEVSKNTGMLIASICGADFVETSHQRGHVRAALYSNNLISSQFIGIHISGGTTEFIEYEWNRYFIKEKIVGQTLDISLGQVIDRIGVEMDFLFPAGSMMEKYLDQIESTGFEKEFKYKANYNSRGINLSGLETYLSELYKNTGNKALVIYTAFENASRLLAEASRDICHKQSIPDVLFCGGVASNKYIQNSLRNKLVEYGINTYFCAPNDCTDNAFGVALIAKDHFEERI